MNATRLCLGGPADWGNVPGWIEALATVIAAGAAIAAAIGAFIAVRYARGVYEIEQQRDVDRDEALERAQADLVAAWIEDAFHAPRMVRVRNSSRLPIFNVWVDAHKPMYSDTLSWPSKSVVPPGHTVEFHFEPSVLDQWPEDEQRDWMQRNVNELRCSINFRDAAGNAWDRDPDGVLKPV